MQSKTFSAIVLALAFFLFQTTAGWTIPWGFKRDAPLRRGPSPDFRHHRPHHHHHHHHHTGTATGTGTGWPAPTGTVIPPFPMSNGTQTVGPTGTGTGYPSPTGWPTPTGF